MNTESTESPAATAIRRVVAEAVEFQLDADRLIPLYTADVNVVNFGGRRVSGRETLAEAMRQALASPLADVKTRVEVQDITFLRDDVAIVACVKHVFDGRDSATPPLPASMGRLTYVMANEGGLWRIASAQTTPILS